MHSTSPPKPERMQDAMLAEPTDDPAPLPETDGGPHKGKPGEARLCIVYRAVRPLDELIRFVVGPDDHVVPDLRRRLPGRGAWVTATRVAVDKAVASKAFSRAFRRQVAAAPDLGEQVERLLERAALDHLALANKAGAVVQGFVRVEDALARKPIVALIHAREAAEDGVSKLRQAVRAEGYGPADVRTIRDFSVDQLDLVLGRANVIHACLLAGPASAGFLARAISLDRYRH
jgi:predicted RNA-binding protein YlxR (DUF448 family)